MAERSPSVDECMYDYMLFYVYSFTSYLLSYRERRKEGISISSDFYYLFKIWFYSYYLYPPPLVVS